MRSAWRIGDLLEVALLLLSISHGDTSIDHLAPVGKLVEVTEVTDCNPYQYQTMLPRWLRYNRTSSTSATLVGIPQLSDLGNVTTFFDKGELVSVEVVEETENPCGNQTTNWMEFHYPKNVTDASLRDLRELLYAIADAVNETDVTKLRVFPRSYLIRHRTGKYTLEDTSLLGGPNQLVVTYPFNCGVLDADRLDEITARMPESYTGVWQSFTGRVVPADPIDPIGRRNTNIWRTVHEVQFRNSLSTVECVQGILCFHPIPVNTFYDAGDGIWDVATKLSLSTHVIGNHSNFLHTVSGPRGGIVGVPFESGSFTFRLDARAKANQTRSAPFRVDVNEVDEAPNHEYQLRLFIKAEELKKPENIVVFVMLLTEALNKRNVTNSNDLIIHDISADSDRTAIVKWSYWPLYNSCNLSRFNKILEALNSGMKEIQALLLVRTGAELKPKQASLKLLANCAAPAASSSPASRNEFDVDAAVEANPANSLPIATTAPNHGESTSFENFVQHRLTWLTDEQKEELKNITLEYFDKIEAKLNEFAEALKIQTQKE